MESLRRFERNTLAIVAIAVAVVFLISLNILSANVLRRSQLDLTEDHLYTLSKGTKDVLASLDEPITMKFFMSPNLAEQSPVHAAYASRVRELLERYVQLSHGKITLQMYSPEPYSKQEDLAIAGGLRGIQVNSAGDMAYFGLSATNSTDDQKSIPFFDPSREPYLEYDLTKLVYSLAHPKKPVIGLLSSLPLGADPSNHYQPWPVFRELTQFFDIQSLRASSVIPKDIDVLLVVHPQHLTQAQIYGIDQFVLRGGKALIFVDPYFESKQYDYTKGPPSHKEISSNLEPLFNAWGIDFHTDKVVGDRTVAQSVQATVAGRSVITDYLPWLALREGNFDKRDVVTAPMSRINMASAGYFTEEPGAKVKMTPIIQSTTDSELIDVDDVDFMPNPAQLLSNFKPTDRRYALAVRVTGDVSSMYPKGPPWLAQAKVAKEEEAKQGDAKSASDKSDAGKSGANAEPNQHYLTKSVKPINVMVVGDVDLLADRFWLQTQNLYGNNVQVPVANNGEFVVNALDNLAGSDDLISLRARGLSYRPFLKTAEIRRKAEAKYRATEEELAQKLKETEGQLQQLRAGEANTGTTILTDAQRAEIAKFRREAIQVRSQLRDVQHKLRQDIESLDTELKIINIWAMPVLISIFALGMWFWGRWRRRPRSGLS